MNENLNLIEILKDCPKGTKLYSTIYGEVKFDSIEKETDLVTLITKHNDTTYVMPNGKYSIFFDGECVLFPSKDQRDWSKFKVKKPKFDPKSLKPFEKVLARITKDDIWHATFFSHYDKEVKWGCYPFVTTSSKSYSMCIPYNDDTMYLRGKTDEAPEYYRYWED